MAIEILPGDQAWSTFRSNPLAQWPTRDQPGRLSPLASPQADCRFSLRGDEKVFCIGSCFARELEAALEARGYEVLSLMRDFSHSSNRLRTDRGMLNKYNVATILNELRWAFGEGEAYSHELVLVGAPDDLLLQDLQLCGGDYADEPERARQFRDSFNRFFQLIRQADVVVLTLGLSEVWFDRQTGLHLNSAPSENFVRCYPGRFELHVFDHAQTLAMLQEIDRLLTAHLKPGLRLMVTVSPVPLKSTFRHQDVLVANSYSKAVLRTAVDSFVATRPHATYFPSYEFALLSDPAAVWSSRDFRHVDPVFIDFIMQSVLAQMGDAAAPTDLVRTRARLLKRVAPAGWRLPSWARFWNKPRPARTGTPAATKGTVLGHVERWDGTTLSGWAFAPDRAAPVEIRLVLDGRLLLSVTANESRVDVAQVHGDMRRNCGFQIALPRSLPTQGQLQVLVDEHTLKILALRGPPD